MENGTVSDTNLCNFIYRDVAQFYNLIYLICLTLFWSVEICLTLWNLWSLPLTKVIHCSLACLSRRIPCIYIYIDSYTNWVGWCWLFFVVASWDPSSFFLAFSQIPNRQKTQAVKFYPEDQATTSGALSFLFGKVVPKLKCTGWWKCKKKRNLLREWPFSIKGLFFSIYVMKVFLEAGSCRWKPVKDWKESGAF